MAYLKYCFYDLEFCQKVTEKSSLSRLLKTGSKKNEESSLNMAIKNRLIKVTELENYLKNKSFLK